MDLKGRSIEDYLPHRPPFLFVSGIDDPYNGAEGKCYLDLTSDTYPYSEDGVFPHLLVLEALGQSIAILQSHYFSSPSLKKSEMGYLVKLNDFLFEDSAKRGNRINLAVRMKKKLGMLVLFRVEASVGKRKICSGEMTIFREAQG